ncbi:PREDICTED: LOW QUALITY PROTEIN: lethal(2) giant larvae protein homolog 1-like [Priapulus caudatus]|uniref:LOW QUALITY PROTEIN: lethal(2) giant larvae protein homolog 1-like n=1 Tax=Priapulus caudatus TaxID=37621 RepID=A0ABM1EX49_PRICU|nr:PREDICTED: LOW QUALITY PROTEIN: lethal(2) giant larvae protein homolog 1-like [Priapulus caudatus]
MLRFIKRGHHHESEARQKLQKELFEFKKTVRHGFPHRPSAMAYDPMLKLLAIGTRNGQVRIYGAPGVEFDGQHAQGEVDNGVTRLYFLPGEGRIISVLEDNSVHMWEWNLKDGESVLELTKSLSVEEQKKVSTCCLTSSGEALLVGTEGGNIYLMDTKTFELMDSVIYQDVVMQNVPDDYKATSPGAVESIIEHPLKPHKFLIGYSRGLMVLWDNKSLNADQTFMTNHQLESLAWVRGGDKFASAHNDGSYMVWNTLSALDLSHGSTTPYGPFPCKAISKISYMTSSGEPYVVFRGGMPRASYGDRNTVSMMRGDAHVVFDFTSKIIEFIVLSDAEENDGRWTTLTLSSCYLHGDLRAHRQRPRHFGHAKGHEALTPKRRPAEDSPLGLPAGHRASDDPPAACTALALHSDWGLVAAGTAHGFTLFDYVQRRAVMSRCTLNASDMRARAYEQNGIGAPQTSSSRCASRFRGWRTSRRGEERPRAATKERRMLAKKDRPSTTQPQVLSLIHVSRWKCSSKKEKEQKDKKEKKEKKEKKGKERKGKLSVEEKAAAEEKHEVKEEEGASKKETEEEVNKEGDVKAAEKVDKENVEETVEEKKQEEKEPEEKSEEKTDENEKEEKTDEEEDKEEELPPLIIEEELPTLKIEEANEEQEAPAEAKEEKEQEKEEEEKTEEVKETKEDKEVAVVVEAVKPAVDLAEEKIRTVERQIEPRAMDDSMASMVRSLLLTQSFLISGAHNQPTLWAGINAGTIYAYTVTVPGESKRQEESVSAQLGKEVQLKHRAPVLAMTITDGTGCPLPDSADVRSERAKQPDMKAGHKIVIASMEQFKIFHLPSLKPYCKYKLTAHEGALVRKVGFVKFRSSKNDDYAEWCLSCLSNQGDVSTYNVPQLRKQLQASCTRKDDISGISSALFTQDGEGFYQNSSSELTRFTISARKRTQPHCHLVLAEGMRPAPPETLEEEEKKPKGEEERKESGEESKEEAATDESQPPSADVTGDITQDSITDHTAVASAAAEKHDEKPAEGATAETEMDFVRIGEGAGEAADDITRDLYHEVVVDKPSLVDFSRSGGPSIITVEMVTDSFPEEVLLEEPEAEESEKQTRTTEADGTVVVTTVNTRVETTREEQEAATITLKVTTVTTTIVKEGSEGKSRQVLTERKIMRMEQKRAPVGGSAAAADPKDAVADAVVEETVVEETVVEDAVARDAPASATEAVAERQQPILILKEPEPRLMIEQPEPRLMITDCDAAAAAREGEADREEAERRVEVTTEESSQLVEEVLAEVREASYQVEATPGGAAMDDDDHVGSQRIVIGNDSFPDEIILEATTASTAECAVAPPTVGEQEEAQPSAEEQQWAALEHEISDEHVTTTQVTVVEQAPSGDDHQPQTELTTDGTGDSHAPLAKIEELDAYIEEVTAIEEQEERATLKRMKKKAKKEKEKAKK